MGDDQASKASKAVSPLRIKCASLFGRRAKPSQKPVLTSAHAGQMWVAGVVGVVVVIVVVVDVVFVVPELVGEEHVFVVVLSEGVVEDVVEGVVEVKVSVRAVEKE